jgi:hypothetical protein
VKRVAAVAWPVIGTVVLALEVAIRIALRDPMPWDVVLWGAVGWYQWLLLAPLVVALTERFPYRPRARWRFFIVHAIAPFFFSLAHSAIYFGLRSFFVDEPLPAVWIARLPAHLTLDFLVYNATVIATHVAVYLRNAWEREQERLAIEQRIARAELDVLRVQLPPETIRERLKSIESAIGDDALEAERQIVKFSAFLRERLREPEAPRHPERSEGSQDATPVAGEILRFAQDDGSAVPRPIPLPLLLLIVIGVIPGVLLMIQAFAMLRSLAQDQPISLNAFWKSVSLSWFSWPVTLLMIWLGSRVKRIAVLVIAAAAAPVVWGLAFHTVRAGFEASRAFLLSSSRAIDFLVFFAIALGALAHQRYIAWRRHAIEVAELDAVLLRTRTRLLRLQLNPHFLFNALNSIAALLEDEREAAKRMAARLRHFVDHVLATTDRQEVPLAEELEQLSTYFAIENVRFGDRLQLALNVGKEARNALIPSFLLQPLVENALRHGLQPTSISVTADIANRSLHVEVADNGKPRNNSMREGIGLSNTRARLRQLYGDAFAFDVERRESGFRASLTIPFRSSLLTAAR